MNHTHSQKKILLISYYFPPSRAIGGKRIAAFAQYLPDHGWQPFVMTIKYSEIEEIDPGSLVNLQSDEIYRVGALPSLRGLYLKIKDNFNRGVAAPSGNTEYFSNKSTAPPDLGLKRKLKIFIASLLFLPDDNSNWIIPAVIKSLRLIRREKIGYILTSCPPYSVHLVGLLIKLVKPRIRWIADFRDPWMVPCEKEIFPVTALSRAIDYWLEKRVLSNSDLVLTTTGNLAGKLSQYYSKIDSNKFVTVPNGFEPSTLPTTSEEKYNIFTISYIGSLYFGRSPEPIFEAIRSLREETKVNDGEIRIKLVGHCDTINGVSTWEIIRKYKLENIVEVISSMPQDQAMDIVRRSHVALLLASEQPFQIPGKVYEYLGLGTPILALTEEGATAELIGSIKSGKAINPNDLEMIKDFILMSLKHAGKANPPENNVREQFTRKTTVERLSNYIDSLS